MYTEIAVVKTDAQYRDYASEIGALVALDPDPATPEGKRLELLALVVETYEKERYRI
jgi:HTH-type transcriptional regulator/antitoxin HigA